MDSRNARFSRADGSAIDIEVNHPSLGWIWTTATADDPETSALFAAAQAGAQPYVTTPAPVPDSLPRLAFMVALHEAGKLDEVRAAIAAADPLTQLKFAEAVEFPRADPMIDQLGALVGLTPAAIDALYVAAAA